MKYVFFCCMLFFSSWGYAQRWKWEREVDSIGRQVAIIESDSALFKLKGKEKDSLQAVYLTLVEELRQRSITRDSFFRMASRINGEAAGINYIVESNEITSKNKMDSLLDVRNHLISRAQSIIDEFRFFPDKRDTFNTLLTEIELYKPRVDKGVADLIRMVSDMNSHYIIQSEGLLKLAESRHPAALSFLMDNLMNFAGRHDPINYGADPSFYVWPGNYPCYQYLMEYINIEYNIGWHLLPDFNKALRKQIIPEKYINLYGNLLYYITQTCLPCRETLLAQYLKEPESSEAQKNKKANVLQLIEYYKNPKK